MANSFSDNNFKIGVPISPNPATIFFLFILIIFSLKIYKICYIITNLAHNTKHVLIRSYY